MVRFIFFTVLQFCLSIVLIFGYFNFGVTIYRKKVPKNMIIALVIGYFSLSSSMLIDVTNSKTPTSVLFIFIPLVFFSFGFFFYSTLSRIRR